MGCVKWNRHHKQFKQATTSLIFVFLNLIVITHEEFVLYSCSGCCYCCCYCAEHIFFSSWAVYIFFRVFLCVFSKCVALCVSIIIVKRLCHCESTYILCPSFIFAVSWMCAVAVCSLQSIVIWVGSVVVFFFFFLLLTWIMKISFEF